MANRYYTLLIIPEKTSQVRRFVLPNWILRSAALSMAVFILLTGMMLFDYWYVMSQIGENKQLQIENRRLKQQVQIFQNKMTTVENTMERVKSFATRLKIIMHVDENGPNLQVQPPDSSHPSPASPTTSAPSHGVSEVDSQYTALEDQMNELTQTAFHTEELLQNEYEILNDQTAFLKALPTRQPTPGYLTSGFGLRTSPYGDRVKMHEGVDIANRIGTVVRAPADGEVVFASSKTGYGLTLILKHGFGMETWYGHLKDFLLKPGETVKRGDKIALLGNTGRSSGPHVHYEVRVRGYPVDPRSYIFEDSIP